MYFYPEKCIKFNQSESRIIADKFEICAPFKINIQKLEELSNSKKPVFDFFLLYLRKNGLRRKLKVCPLDTQIKDISF